MEIRVQLALADMAVEFVITLKMNCKFSAGDRRRSPDKTY